MPLDVMVAMAGFQGDGEQNVNATACPAARLELKSTAAGRGRCCRIRNLADQLARGCETGTACNPLLCLNAAQSCVETGESLNVQYRVSYNVSQRIEAQQSIVTGDAGSPDVAGESGESRVLDSIRDEAGANDDRCANSED